MLAMMLYVLTWARAIRSLSHNRSPTTTSKRNNKLWQCQNIQLRFPKNLYFRGLTHNLHCLQRHRRWIDADNYTGVWLVWGSGGGLHTKFFLSGYLKLLPQVHWWRSGIDQCLGAGGAIQCSSRLAMISSYALTTIRITSGIFCISGAGQFVDRLRSTHCGLW